MFLIFIMDSNTVAHTQLAEFESKYLDNLSRNEFCNFCEHAYGELLHESSIIANRLESLEQRKRKANPAVLLRRCNRELGTDFNDCEKLHSWLQEKYESLSRDRLLLDSSPVDEIDDDLIVEMANTDDLLELVEGFIDDVEAILLRKKLPDLLQRLTLAHSELMIRYDYLWEQIQIDHGRINRYFHSSFKLYQHLYEFLPPNQFEGVEKVCFPGLEIKILNYLSAVSHIINTSMGQARRNILPLNVDVTISGVLSFYQCCEDLSNQNLSRLLETTIMAGRDSCGSSVKYLQYLHSKCEARIRDIDASTR